MIPLPTRRKIVGNHIRTDDTTKRKPRALNDTPYWIMQVPRELIPNHSEILTPETYGMIEANRQRDRARELYQGACRDAGRSPDELAVPAPGRRIVVTLSARF